MKKILGFITVLLTLLLTGCFSEGSKDEVSEKKITKAEATSITIYYDNPTWFASANNINIHYNAGNGWTAVPGVAMAKVTDQYAQWGGWATTTIAASSLTFCFNNGSSWDNNSGKDYIISSPGIYTVKNGVITKQGITIDLYVAGNAIYPSYDVAGLPVSIYKDNVLYATSTITYTTSHGVYATFKNVVPGSYKVVMNSEIDSTYNGHVLLKGENSFAITSTMSYFSGDILFDIIPAKQGWLGVSFSVTGDSQSTMLESKLIGQKLKLYRNDVYVKDLDITNYSYFINEVYASTHDLISGTYKVVLDTTINNVKYTGTASVYVDGTNPNETTTNITVTATPLNSITVYYDNPTWFAAGNINMHYNAGSGWTAVPGIAMTKITDYYGSWGGWAKSTVTASTLTFCFNNGSSWDNNSGKNYYISKPGVYTVKNGVLSEVN